MGKLDVQKIREEQIKETHEWRQKAPPTARYMHLFQQEAFGVGSRVATHLEALGMQQGQDDDGGEGVPEQWETAPLRSLASSSTDPGHTQVEGAEELDLGRIQAEGIKGKGKGKGKGKEKGKGTGRAQAKGSVIHEIGGAVAKAKAKAETPSKRWLTHARRIEEGKVTVDQLHAN